MRIARGGTSDRAVVTAETAEATTNADGNLLARVPYGFARRHGLLPSGESDGTVLSRSARAAQDSVSRIERYRRQRRTRGNPRQARCAP